MTSVTLKRGDYFLYSYKYQILGDENLAALTDSTATVIGILDEASYLDFYNFCVENGLDVSAEYKGVVHDKRQNGYMVEFAVQPTHIYFVTRFVVVQRDAEVDSFTEYALP